MAGASSASHLQLHSGPRRGNLSPSTSTASVGGSEAEDGTFDDVYSVGKLYRFGWQVMPPDGWLVTDSRPVRGTKMTPTMMTMVRAEPDG